MSSINIVHALNQEPLLSKLAPVLVLKKNCVCKSGKTPRAKTCLTRCIIYSQYTLCTNIISLGTNRWVVFRLPSSLGVICHTLKRHTNNVYVITSMNYQYNSVKLYRLRLCTATFNTQPIPIHNLSSLGAPIGKFVVWEVKWLHGCGWCLVFGVMVGEESKERSWMKTKWSCEGTQDEESVRYVIVPHTCQWQSRIVYSTHTVWWT